MRSDHPWLGDRPWLQVRFGRDDYSVHVEPAGPNADQFRVVRQMSTTRTSSSFATATEAAAKFAEWVKFVEERIRERQLEQK